MSTVYNSDQGEGENGHLHELLIGLGGAWRLWQARHAEKGQGQGEGQKGRRKEGGSVALPPHEALLLCTLNLCTCLLIPLPRTATTLNLTFALALAAPAAHARAGEDMMMLPLVPYEPPGPIIQYYIGGHDEGPA